MARPTLSRLSGVPSRAPEQREAPGLVVAAPIEVRAPRNATADFLAEALGIAAPGIQAAVKQRRDRALEAGAVDAQLNRVDAKRAAEDREYGYAAARVEAEAKSREAVREWTERYTQELDKGAPAEEIAKDFDAFMQERVASYVADPRVAAPVAAILTDSLQNVLGQHQKAQADEFKATAVANAGDAIREAVAAGKPAPVVEQHELLRRLLGGKEANEALVDLVGSLAQERGDPGLIDALLPEKWADGTPGVRSIGALNAKLNQYAYYAANARDEMQSAATKAKEAAVENEMLQITVLASQGKTGEARRRLIELAQQGVGINRSDFAALTSFLDSREDRWRGITFPAAKYAQARAEMATNFESRTVAEWNAYGVTLAAALPPADRDNFLGQWADDVASAAGRQRTETEAIKRARSYLAGMLAPTPGPLGAISGTGKALQARALFEFDKRVAAGEDPDQLAEELVQRDEKKIGAISQKEAAQNVDGAAKMLSLGQLTDEQFVAMYQNDDGVVEKIREAVRKKAITQDEARRALRALAQ